MREGGNMSLCLETVSRRGNTMSLCVEFVWVGGGI